MNAIVHKVTPNANPAAAVYTTSKNGAQALPPLRFDSPKRNQTGFIVSGGSRSEGYRVAGRWSEAVTPGSYQVWVRARLPYDMTDGPDKADSDKIERAPDAVAVGEFRFPLTVLPLNAARLTLSAENLKQGISEGQGAYPTETLIEQLFALPANIARPVWLDLMQTPHIEPTTRGDILCALILRKDIEAANLLARAGWRADPRLETEDGRIWRGSCLATLRILYRGAGDPMKKRIESLYIHYSGKPPAQDEIVIGYP